MRDGEQLTLIELLPAPVILHQHIDEGARMARISHERWNGWHIQTDYPAFVYDGDGTPGYQVDLDRMLDPAGVVFWTFQILQKPWGSYAFNGFMTAIDDVLDPQTNLVHPKGQRAFTPETIRARVAEFAANGY